MRIPVIPTTALLLAWALLPAEAPGQQQKPYPEQGQQFEVRERFAGALPPAGPPGGPLAAPLRVSLRNWAVRGGQRVELEDAEGFRVVQLLAGEATTVIQGQRIERQEGEFWAVPAGVAMTVETEDDTALLQVFAVGGG